MRGKLRIMDTKQLRKIQVIEGLVQMSSKNQGSPMAYNGRNSF